MTAEQQIDPRDAEIVERLKYDTPFFAKHHLKIVNTRGQVVALEPNYPQLVFDEALEKQRLAGAPQRAIVLKARKHGISTWVQAKMSQRYMQLPYHDAIVVAHVTPTATKLMKMGRIMWDHFPTNSFVPKVRGTRPDGKPGGRQSKEMQFANGSSLLVDTAENLSSGAGSTPLSLHLSELALYRDAQEKMTAIGNAVPDVPESLVVIESTARGDNYFKELWDKAEGGQSDYVPIFLPWYDHPEYVRAFRSEEDRERFEAGIGEGPVREDEPGAVTLMEQRGFDHDLILRKLHWRYWKVLSAEINSDLKTFKQEFPSTPGEAFIVSGSRVFSIHLTSKVVEQCKRTDPLAGRGWLEVAATRKLKSSRTGKLLEVPSAAAWKSEHAVSAESALWKVWQHPVKAGDPVDPDEPDGAKLEKDRQYIVQVDPASDDELVEGEDTAFHAVQVLDHQTLEQVAVLRMRGDADEAALQAFLAALYWNRAWLSAETTGGYGRSMVIGWKHDYHYPFVYKRRRADDEDNEETKLLGFDTNRRTKPLLIDGVKELLRQEVTGLRDLTTALELRDLVRLPNGRVAPPRKGYSDCFMAWAIGEYIAAELPVKQSGKKRDHHPYVPKNRVGGY